MQTSLVRGMESGSSFDGHKGSKVLKGIVAGKKLAAGKSAAGACIGSPGKVEALVEAATLHYDDRKPTSHT